MPLNNGQYEVDLVQRADVRDFIEENHYSQSINGVISDYCFAMSYEGRLIGAMIYGKLAMANQWKKYVRSPSEILELRRLVLVDDTPKNAESWFIGRTLRWLKKNTDVKAVVSYADPNYGHEGTIYKASNFDFVGQTSAGKVIMWNDKKYHDKTIRTKYKGELKPFAQRVKAAIDCGEARYVHQVPKNVYLKRL